MVLILLLFFLQVHSKVCYADSTIYYLTVQQHCYPTGDCCKSNFECESGCCDAYTRMCNAAHKTKHFLDNFPLSTACMMIPKKAQEMTDLVKHQQTCTMKREEANAKRLTAILVPISVFVLSLLVGGAVTMVLITKARQRNQKMDLDIGIVQEKMRR